MHDSASFCTLSSVRLAPSSLRRSVPPARVDPRAMLRDDWRCCSMGRPPRIFALLDVDAVALDDVAALPLTPASFMLRRGARFNERT